MADSIWELYRTLVRWRRAPDGERDDEEASRGFVPSPLDLSVRIGHGGPDDDVVRELSEIEEQARDAEQYGRRD